MCISKCRSNAIQLFTCFILSNCLFVLSASKYRELLMVSSSLDVLTILCASSSNCAISCLSIFLANIFYTSFFQRFSFFRLRSVFATQHNKTKGFVHNYLIIFSKLFLLKFHLFFWQIYIKNLFSYTRSVAVFFSK